MRCLKVNRQQSKVTHCTDFAGESTARAEPLMRPAACATEQHFAFNLVRTGVRVVAAQNLSEYHTCKMSNARKVLRGIRRPGFVSVGTCYSLRCFFSCVSGLWSLVCVFFFVLVLWRVLCVLACVLCVVWVCVVCVCVFVPPPHCCCPVLASVAA